MVYMPYLLEVFNSRPTDLWLYRNATDNLIRINPAVVSGTVDSALALVTGADNSFKTATASSIDFDASSSIKNYRLPFSIEVWAITGGEVDQDIVVSLTGLGFTYEDGLIKFTVPLNSGNIEITAPVKTEKAFHLVGTYTGKSIDLFVDGRQVGSYSLTNSQFESGINSTPDLTVWSNNHVQALAVYERALSAKEIERHYSAGTTTANPYTESLAGGLYIDTTVTPADTTISINQAPHWRGRATNCHVEKNVLTQDLDVNGDILAADYQFAVPFAGGEEISSLEIIYEGHGIEVTYSTDLDTWTPIDNFGVIVSPDTELPLVFNVHMPSTARAELYNFHVLGFSNLRMESQVELTVDNEVSNGLSFEKNQQARHSGIFLDGGEIVLGGTEKPIPMDVKTIQMFVYLESGSLVTNYSPTATYVDGVAKAIPTGRWCLVHLQNPARTNSPITLSGNVRLAHITLYDHVLTSTEIQQALNSASGIIEYKIDETLPIGLGPDTVVTLLSD